MMLEMWDSFFFCRGRRWEDFHREKWALHVPLDYHLGRHSEVRGRTETAMFNMVNTSGAGYVSINMSSFFQPFHVGPVIFF